MKPEFHKTVNILVQAYLNDELAHSFCSACAVGNIVAHALGTKPRKGDDLEFDNNFFENGDYAAAWYDALNLMGHHEPGLRQIEATGYTKSELRLIERAFETAEGKPEMDGMWRGKQTDPTWMFNGLMAVVDVLADIHNVDLSVREDAKLLFAKP